jgi:two-component system aerobic respiration control sensor histidine kinase ArcB
MAGTNNIIGKTDFYLPWKDNAKIIRQIDSNVIKNDTPIELEEHGELANGQQVTMLTRKAPFYR